MVIKENRYGSVSILLEVANFTVNGPEVRGYQRIILPFRSDFMDSCLMRTV